jgi:tetraacyldisaccharide 4'-kinase
MKFWYKRSWLSWLLWPLHLVTLFESHRRRRALLKGVDWCKTPVIVVGNLTVGGTGKTPIVIALVNYFQQQGLHVGVISRGYGSKAKEFPLEVDQSLSTHLAGDEPKLIQNATGCRVVIAPNRLDAYQLISSKSGFLQPVDIVIADDGLQHYALPRFLELVVVDAKRQFGNQLCLPAGPLRESLSRLNSVDYIVNSSTANEQRKYHFGKSDKNFSIQADIKTAVNLVTHQQKAFSDFSSNPVSAIAAIGQPDKFFDLLKKKGLNISGTAFADHYEFKASDMPLGTIFMTEKDAVKCLDFAEDRMWFVPLEVELPVLLLEDIKQKLQLNYHHLFSRS